MSIAGATGHEPPLQDASSLEVIGEGIWCRDQEEELAARASDEIIDSTGFSGTDGWGCCVIFTSDFDCVTKEPTPRQKHLGLWGHYRMCSETSLPPGFKEAELGAYATIETEGGFRFAGIARFPLSYLIDYLMRDIGLVARLDVFLSDRKDVLLEEVACEVGKVGLKQGQLGIARYLLGRGEVPIRYNTWETSTEFSAVWKTV